MVDAVKVIRNRRPHALSSTAAVSAKPNTMP